MKYKALEEFDDSRTEKAPSGLGLLLWRIR